MTSQSPGVGWPGLPAGAALERVIVLNRRSFLLLDRRADAPVALASRLYTASRLGHAYPVDPSAATACLEVFRKVPTACLEVFRKVLERAGTGTPEWTLAAGYVADGWCEEELEQAEAEWEEAGMPA